MSQVLVAADEYLHGNTLSSKDITAIKARISNLEDAGTEGYQTIMAKGFGLGFYVGTNEDYELDLSGINFKQHDWVYKAILAIKLRRPNLQHEGIKKHYG